MSRKCGACSLCCVLPAIPQLGKPANVPCVHLTPSGCGIYETRPQGCRDFKCEWLRGGVGDQTSRPDHVGGYVLPLNGDGLTDTKRGFKIVAPAGKPRWHRSTAMRKLVQIETSRGGDVLVLAGDSRRILTSRKMTQEVNDQDGRPVSVEEWR